MSEPAIVGLQDWLAALSQTSVLIELGALLVCGLLAWQLARLVAKAFADRERNSIMFGRRIVDGVLFPALLLCLAYAARSLLAYSVPLALFKLAIPVLISLLVIRLGVKVLQAAFNDTPAIRLLERSISWIAWLAMVLWVSGLLPLVMEELDQISWTVGGAQLSVRKIIEGTLTAGLVLIISLWISSAIEAKLLRKATGSELSLRKAFSNAARALLMFVGLLMALSAVGIDLTALSVLGGAIGVGIGFGLQKLAANYVSG
ncbi:MAG: mechanosensitive ion channel protein, partial [Betaproteobacteria bacterium HGW-Betaproteobacteria-18]